MRLGKLPPKHDDRTFLFSSLVHDTLPAFPMALSRDEMVPPIVSMFDNDRVGDCTCASLGYLEDVWTNFGQIAPLLTTPEVISFYSEVTGYVLGDENTDNGAAMLDVLKRVRSVGIGASRRKIAAFVKIDHTDVDHVKSAINLFGGVYVGANMPRSAQVSIQHGEDWIGPQNPETIHDEGTWGGHCMSCSRYDETSFWFRTWGRLQRADQNWWRKYVDECYGLLAPEWKSPLGLDFSKLQRYLSEL